MSQKDHYVEGHHDLADVLAKARARALLLVT